MTEKTSKDPLISREIIFYIKQPKIDVEKQLIECGYSVDSYNFVEKFYFDDYSIYFQNSSAEIIGLVNTLAICVATSYYKINAAKKIGVDFEITPYQKDLLLALFDDGLREFAYVNDLEIPREVELSVNMTTNYQQRRDDSFNKTFSNKYDKQVIPLGGGKDSAVTSMMFPEAHLFTINPSKPMFDVAEQLGRKLYAVKREIDPQLFELNNRGALNGHIPVTAIVSTVACIVAKLLDCNTVLMSNEYSASEPTRIVEHGGNQYEVNHQYSKSYEAETLLAKTFDHNTNNSVSYISFLRPLSELAITKILSNNINLAKKILSCNNAFKVYKEKQTLWCGKCPKCFFVFLIFAPYFSPVKLTEIFQQNLFENINNVSEFEKLIHPEQKPFECVGETNECRSALNFLFNSSSWNEFVVIKEIKNNLEDAQIDISKYSINDYMGIQYPNNLPPEYLEIIKEALKR